MILGLRAVYFALALLLVLAPLPLVHLLAKPALDRRSVAADKAECRAIDPAVGPLVTRTPSRLSRVAATIYYVMEGAGVATLFVIIFAFYGGL
jgi:hypothetical protein